MFHKFKIISTALFLFFVLHSNATGLQEIPAKVKAAAEAKAGGQKIAKWIPDKLRGKYIAVLDSETTVKIIEVDLQGQWLRTTTAMLPASIPAPVMAVFKNNYAQKGYEVDNYSYVEDHAEGKYYMAEASSDEKDLVVKVSPAGKLIKAENR